MAIHTVSPEALVPGKRQKAIIALPGLRTDQGMRTSEIAQALGRTDTTNIHGSLTTLSGRGLIEPVPNSAPRRWRLIQNFRSANSAA